MFPPRALLLLAVGLASVAGQRSNALIQSLVTRLKNSPKHYSISPSYTSDRKLEVLPVSGLPLQSDLVAGSESGGAAPSITDVITGNLGKFETSGEGDDLNVPSEQKDDSDAVSLASQSRPRVKKPRRRRPGRPGARPARLARPGGRPPLGRRERPRPPRRNPNKIEQVPVEEFFPGPEEDEEDKDFYLEAARPARPGRRGPLKEPVYRPSGLGKRKHESPPLVFQSRPPRKKPQPPRPFKNEIRPNRKEPRPPPRRDFGPPGPPRKKRKPSGLPRRPSKTPHRKPGNFRPPQKVYKGFEPSFESSNPYNEGPHYLDDMDHKKPTKSKRPKRKRRPRPPPAPIPDLEPFDAEENDVRRPNHPSSSLTDFNPFNKPDQGMNFETQPGFDRNSHKSPMSMNKPGPPYETELSPFSDEEPRLPSARPASPRPTRPRGSRPKRQRVPATFKPATFDKGPSIYNEFNDVASNSDDNSGFFQNVQENFPSIEAFGIGWDSQKIRRKRSANGGGGLLPLVRYTPPSKNRRKGRRGTTGRRSPPPRRAQHQQQSNRRQGPLGFWDDAEFDAGVSLESTHHLVLKNAFDTEFFNGGAPPSYSSFESFSQQNRFQVPEYLNTQRSTTLQLLRSTQCHPESTAATAPDHQSATK